MENERDVIELVSEDGEKISLEIVDDFFFNGTHYAVLMDDDPEADPYDYDRDAFLARIVTEGDEEFYETVGGEELEDVSDYYFNEYLFGEEDEDDLDPGLDLDLNL